MLEYLSYFYVHGEVEEDKWLENLLEKTLKHDQKFLNLYRKIPFQQPPGEIRAVKYRYKFTDEGERKNTGKYWKREKIEIIASES
jgi:Zn-dependent M16 (insulinase) family peptidase